MQACHKITKGRGNLLKWDERNMFCGCSGSNKYEAHNRDVMKAIFKQLWPEDFEYLEGLKGTLKVNEDLMYHYWKQKRWELKK